MTRRLPPAPSEAQVARDLAMLHAVLLELGQEYPAAHEVAFSGQGSSGTKVPIGFSDPTGELGTDAGAAEMRQRVALAGHLVSEMLRHAKAALRATRSVTLPRIPAAAKLTTWSHRDVTEAEDRARARSADL